MAKELIDAGELGGPFTFQATYVSAYLADLSAPIEKPWKLMGGKGGGVLGDLGSHLILDEFARCGVRFALEVHPTEMAYNLETAEQALAVLDHRREFGFNFDPSHLVWQGIDPVVFIKRLGTRILHAHAKDDEVQADEVRRSGVLAGGAWTRPDRGFRFRVPGWGDVNWRRVLSALVAVGYDYLLSLSRSRSHRPGGEGAAQEREYFAVPKYCV